MRPWWQEPAFWRDIGPFLFTPTTLAEAENEVADLVEWLGLDDLPPSDPPLRILDVGCGVGRLAIPLAKRGYRVVGIDSIDDYRREARRRATVAGVELDIRALDLFTGSFTDPEPFDVILCSFSLIGYHDDPVSDIELVRGFRELLAPGGRLLLVTRHPDGPYGRFRHASLDGASLNEDRRFERERGLQQTTWTIMRAGRQRVYRTTLRIYGAGDLRSLLEFCGVEPVRVSEQRAEQRIITVGRRPKEAAE